MKRHLYLCSLILALMCLIVGVEVQSSAHAGTYDVLSCSESPDQKTNNAWQSFTSGALVQTKATCPPSFSAGGEQPRETGLSATDELNPITFPIVGATAGWRMIAPTGTTITRLRYARYMGKSDVDWALFTRTADGTVLDTCDYNPVIDVRCAAGTAGLLTLSFDRAGLSTQKLEAGILCAPKPAMPASTECPAGIRTHFVWHAIYGSRVTISDPTPPQLSSISGSLVDGSPRWRSTTDQVVVSATDTVGIQETRIEVDGRELARTPRTCDYTKPVPCTNEGGATYTIDWSSAGIPDGEHDIHIVAVDAAGNETTKTFSVNVDSRAPETPQNLSTPNAIQDGTAFPVSWINPLQTGTPIIKANWKACEEINLKNCVEGSSTARDISNITVNLPNRGRYITTVWLTDAAGNTDPLRHSAVLILENRDTRGPDGGGGPGGGGENPVKPIQPRLTTPSVKRSGKAFLKFSGAIIPAVDGNVVFELSYRSKRAFKRFNIPIKRGTWKISIKTPKYLKRRLKGLTVTVSYPGGMIENQPYLSTKILRKL